MDEIIIRKEEYNKVNKPEELLSFMNKYIKYGIYGIDNKIYDNFDNNSESSFQIACQTKYTLCDEERLLKYGYGHCWDQVELERAWFKKHGYEYKTYFIWFYIKGNNNYSTHSFLVYKDNNKYYYFENSDYYNKGIYEFKSYEDAIKYRIEKHIESNKNYGNVINDNIINKIQVFEFNIDKYGIDTNDYWDNIFNSKLIYNNGKFIK